MSHFKFIKNCYTLFRLLKMILAGKIVATEDSSKQNQSLQAYAPNQKSVKSRFPIDLIIESIWIFRKQTTSE